MARTVSVPRPITPGILRVVCAWCGHTTGAKLTNGPDEVTHGICRQCARKLHAEIEKAFAGVLPDAATPEERAVATPEERAVATPEEDA